jgi:sortase B
MDIETQASPTEKRSGKVAIIALVAVLVLGIAAAVLLVTGSPKDTAPAVTEPIVIEVEESAITTAATTTTVTEPVKVIPPPDPRIEDAYKINTDVIGWIQIDGTEVDEALLQGKDNDYYLSKDINKNYLFAGSLYADFRDNFGYSETMHTDQMVIYGHNMLAGTKFGTLKKYRVDYNYVDEAPIVNLSNRYRTYQYVIFAGINTSQYGEDDVKYWRVHNFGVNPEDDTSIDFQTYYDWIQKRNLLKNTKVAQKVTVTADDKIVALSTCSSEGYRWVLFARRLHEDETPDMFLNLS